ncbi:MAG: hypothetical protein IKV28_05260 [Bacteroidales bacterium]|nr:hypothetical protein [Bacteroidales bacterium]
MTLNSHIRTLAAILFVWTLLISSCQTEKPQPTPPPAPEEELPILTAPSVTVSTDEVHRFSATFTLSTDHGEEYAYRLREYKYTASPDKLFASNEAIVGSFDETNQIAFTLTDLKKDTDYLLYAATRISKDTLLYSQMIEIPFSTNVPYTDFITLEQNGLNHISYHIEKPEDAVLYRHLVVDKLDFIFFQNSVGATHSSYLDSFGLTEKNSKDIQVHETFSDLYGYTTNIFSDMEYVIIAGTGETDEKMTPQATQYLEFTTPVAEPLDADIHVEVLNIGSITADVHVTIPEEVDRYRIFVMSEADYRVALNEDEDMVRRYIMGDWTDRSNEYKKSIEFTANGLTPNTPYKVGLMAFDEAMREQLLIVDFSTEDPTLPLPEFDIRLGNNDTPWKSATLEVKITNAVSAKAFVATRSQYDAVLDREGTTPESIIYANGIPLTESELYAAQHGGIAITYSNLSPITEYVYGIMATNTESMSSYEIFHFSTETAPVVDNEWKSVLPGNYTATAFNHLGEAVSFDITIATGVNEKTRQKYQALNRLVCLGFDAAGVSYHSPEQLLEQGWASTEEEANQNYGPKFYLEFNMDGSITTGVPPTYDNGYYYLDEPMAHFNGTTLWFEGLYTDPGDDYVYKSPAPHPVEILNNGNTIIIHPHIQYNEWSEKYYTYYPGVYCGNDHAYGGTAAFYAQGGDGTLVLTRKSDNISQFHQPLTSLQVISSTEFTMHERNFRNK